jgi:predicted transcriptional regulator
MARRAAKRPTDVELEILKVLWEQGASTVREVREALLHRRRVAHTTVLTMLQIMAGKGLVECDRSKRAHVYRARDARPTVARRFTHDLLTRVFEGSTPELVLYALQSKKATPEELREIRRVIDEIERGIR